MLKIFHGIYFQINFVDSWKLRELLCYMNNISNGHCFIEVFEVISFSSLIIPDKYRYFYCKIHSFYFVSNYRYCINLPCIESFHYLTMRVSLKNPFKEILSKIHLNKFLF